MSQRIFRIGTRGSRLALLQTDLVLELLRTAHLAARFEVRTIRTAGDRSRASLSEIGGRGVFVVELERSLLAGEIDVAVHSLKDLPSRETPGLAIAAVAARGDPRDALVAREGLTLERLPAGARVGTGSPRRAAQLLAARPDLSIADIRGNVDTRIAKIEAGEYDAAVLAAVGLARLGCLDRASELLPFDVMLPAVGQAALAVQVRADDGEAIALVGAADHTPTRAAVAAERAFERFLGGGCNAAIAAYAVILRGGDRRKASGATKNLDEAFSEAVESSVWERTLRLRGLVADTTGKRLLRGEIEGAVAEADAIGVRLAERLIAEGAAALLEAAS